VLDAEPAPGAALLPLAAAGGASAVDAAATIGEALKLLEPPQPTMVSVMMKKQNENKP
jgi:hypothetical protein